MKDLKHFIKTNIREFLNENENLMNQIIERSSPANGHIKTPIKKKTSQGR